MQNTFVFKIPIFFSAFSSSFFKRYFFIQVLSSSMFLFKRGSVPSFPAKLYSLSLFLFTQWYLSTLNEIAKRVSVLLLANAFFPIRQTNRCRRPCLFFLLSLSSLRWVLPSCSIALFSINLITHPAKAAALLWYCTTTLQSGLQPETYGAPEHCRAFFLFFLRLISLQ